MRHARLISWILLGGMILLGGLAGAQAAAPQAPGGLLCELSPEPLGIENLTPSYSWIVNDEDRDELQSAWQIIVTRAAGEVAWDSGRVASAQSTSVRHGGAPLAPGEVYHWRVRSWDRDGNESPWSEPQRIVTALKDRWQATPIWSAEPSSFTLLRRELTLEDRPIERALAFVSGRDTHASRQYVYRLLVNGGEVGVGPARGFDGQVPYQVFDVTDRLVAGEPLVLAAIAYSADAEKDFLLQLEITHTDGSRRTILTDGDWKALPADAIYNMNRRYFSYYEAGPENIDARRLPVGWENAGFDDSAWPKVATRPAFTETLVSQPMRNIELHEVEPARIVRKPDGSLFFEFDRQIIGSMKVTLAGRDGAQVAVRLGEETDGENSVRYNARTKVSYDETWTLREGEQTIGNFGYRGFRYGELVPVGGFELGEPRITAIVLRYPFDDTAADYESSDATLNEVWELCKYSIKSTSLDVYQDCPTRERGPYEGDALINQLSHYATDREYAIARYSAEYLYYIPTWPTEYKQQSVLMAWEDYLATGNADSLERHYEVLRGKTLEPFMNEAGLVVKPVKDDLVDWPVTTRDGYEFTTVNTVINAFNAAALETLAQIAGVLGHGDDRAAYEAKAALARGAIVRELYDPAAAQFRDGLESDHRAAHASFFPLALGLVPEAEQARVGQVLAAGGMACSVYGSQFLLDGLYRAGLDEAALGLMISTEPTSWHHMIHGLGATVVTEAWTPESKPNMSFAHAWASAPANVIPRRLMGILPLEPGYGKVLVRPQTGGLEWARLKLPTIRGTIEMAFRDGGEGMQIELALPANMTAEVWVPAPAGASVRVDGEPRAGRREVEYVVFDNIGSGRHTFAVHARN